MRCCGRTQRSQLSKCDSLVVTVGIGSLNWPFFNNFQVAVSIFVTVNDHTFVRYILVCISIIHHTMALHDTIDAMIDSIRMF